MLAASEKMFDKIDYIEGLHSSLPDCKSKRNELSATVNFLDIITEALKVVDIRSKKMVQKFDLMKVD